MKSYGAEELTVSSPPYSFPEKLQIEEVKLYLGTSGVITQNDPMIDGFIVAARSTAELLQGRELVPKSWDLTLDCFPCSEIELRQPLRSVSLIRYRDSDGDTHDVDSADYIVDTARGIVKPAFGKSWPSFTPYPSGAVLIRYTAGYAGDHPYWLNDGKMVLNGMLMLISSWYYNRIPFVEGSVAEIPYTIKDLLGFRGVQRVR